MFRKIAVAILAFALSLSLFSVAFGASRTLEDIKKNGILEVALEDGDWGAFHFWKDGVPEGFEIDLCNAIAEALGVKASFIPVPWGDGEPGSLSGAWDKGSWNDSWDLIAGGVTITEERAKNVTFTDWMFNGGQVLLIRHDSDIASFEDTQGKKIGGLVSSVNTAVIKEQIPDSNLVVFEKTAPAFEALLEGSIMGFMVDSPLALEKVKAHSGILAILDTPLSRERLGLVLPKDCDSNLLKHVNKVIKKERKTLFKKWFK